MKRNRIYITAISGLLLISLTIGSFSSVQAENPPGNPYSVYGYVTLNGNPAPADVKIILSIPNRADHTGLTNAKGQYTVDFDAVQGETASFTVYVYNQYVHPTNTLSFKITNPSPHGYFINLSVTVSGGNNPPNVPSNPFPALGATGVPIVTFLSWIGGDPDAADTVTYDVYFGTTNPPPIKTHDQSGTTYNPSPLTYNTTYYWMAVSWDNHGASTIGPIWSFTTGFTQNHCPDKPQNPSPLNGTTGVVTNPTLSVTVTDPDGGLLNVRFYNAANNILIGMTYALDGNTASVIWSGLAFDTTYHWYTIANDSWLENTSDTWGFTTKSSGDGGDGGGGEETLINKAPIADASAGEPYQGYVNQQITFDGSKSYDPDGKIMSWSWTFGDGNSGTGEVTTHIYTQVGSHMVVLTVTDNKSATGTDYTTAVVTIPNSPPTTPTLTGGPGVLGHKNISYDFQTVSTDADNDMIKYIGNTITYMVCCRTLCRLRENIGQQNRIRDNLACYFNRCSIRR
ncbi:MAG: PKD domain-containing protein [Euryarchaeota archaeon]|nr:PKD domain-containing protein [Euryarchaeota archaeon]